MDDVALLETFISHWAAQCEAAGMRLGKGCSGVSRLGMSCSPKCRSLRVLFMSRMRREINKVTGAVLAVMQMLYWSVVVNREENEGKAVYLLVNLWFFITL